MGDQSCAKKLMKEVESLFLQMAHNLNVLLALGLSAHSDVLEREKEAHNAGRGR